MLTAFDLLAREDDPEGEREQQGTTDNEAQWQQMLGIGQEGPGGGEGVPEA